MCIVIIINIFGTIVILVLLFSNCYSRVVILDDIGNARVEDIILKAVAVRVVHCVVVRLHQHSHLRVESYQFQA
jgi:hypothetical protein